MKKNLSFLFFFLSFTFFLFSAPENNVKEIRLENGLSVFTLEDFSTPLISIQFVTKAGISSQTAENAGFFTLYSRILSDNLQNFAKTSVECDSDCTKISVTIAPSQLKNILESFSKNIFSPDFTDDILQKELSALKNEVLEKEKSVSGFINAAIDSRVFSDSPWKHDSGIYPALFCMFDSNHARVTLNEISEKYFTPKNSAIFINGNFETDSLIKLLEQTFGIYYSSGVKNSEKTFQNYSQQKKFVIHHQEISDELTQIVLQYTDFTPEQSDLTAAFLNTDNSEYKTNLLQNNSLLIPGSEYIDASSARKANSSRLIIQSLMQTDGKISPFNQVSSFIKISEQSLNNISQNELNYAKFMLSENFHNISKNSQIFMNYLASYWAIKDYDFISEDNSVFSKYSNSSVCAAMMYRPDFLQTITIDSIQSVFDKEEPFIFVIMNSKSFEKNKAEFLNEGFEEVSINNSSWYSQELYKQITLEALNTFNSQTQTKQSEDISSDLFYSNNIRTVKTDILENNIPVYAKNNSDSSCVTILVNIKGGKINSLDNNGFEELLVQLLSANIQNQIYKKTEENLIKGEISVTAQTDLTDSSIIIECFPQDFNQCIHSIKAAILTPLNIPAAADRIVSNLQYKKRLSNGDAEYQMFSQITKLLYGKKTIYNIFEAEKDILQNTTFDDIMEKYTSFTDSSRYAFIITGNVPEDYIQIISEDFNILRPGDFKTLVIPDFSIPSKKQMICKIKHTFLTDTPASEAGPMPQLLVPTTEFTDPAIYLYKLPDNKEDSFLCSALFVYLQNTLPEKINEKKLNYPSSTKKSSDFNPKDCEISLKQGNSDQNFTTITFKNVTKPYEITKVYNEEINNLIELLSSIQTTQKISRDIKNLWIEDFFGLYSTNTGLAKIICKNSDIFQENGNSEEYLLMYKTIEDAKPEDFIRIIENYVKTPSLKIYSSDSKK